MSFDLVATINRCESHLQSNPGHEETRWMLARLYFALADSVWHSRNSNEGPESFDPAVNLYKRALSLEANKIASIPDKDLKFQYIEAYYKIALVSHLQSKQAEAIEFVKVALTLQEELIENHPLGKLGIRLFQTRSSTIANIGHLVNEPEFFAKMGLLGLRRPFRGVLLAPSNRVVNRCALNYWRRHMLAVTDPALVKRLEPLQKELEYNTFWIQLPPQHVFYFWSGLNAVQRAWEAAGKKPLLSLTRKHRSDGWECLKKLGVPEEAWFVTLHVRDQKGGKLGKKVDILPTAHRDADIFTYTEAIEAIVERGGWVIRMGDQSMKPLPPMKNVIDYVHTEYRCDWMDIFCVAQSRFFLGTASGLNGVPINFGVPSVLTNVSPMNIFPLCGGDIYIPKLMRSNSTGKFLSFKESLSPPFNHCFHTSVYTAAGVSTVPNSPTELRQAALEMLDRLEGKLRYTEEDEALQKRFEVHTRLSEPHGIGCRIGRDFLRSYSELL